MPSPVPQLTEDKVVTLVRDVFLSAAERDIYTGDSLSIEVVSAGGIRKQTMPLRHD